MLLEDYRDAAAKEFAGIVLESLDLMVDPSNGWIIDAATDNYIQVNGRSVSESVYQPLKDYGFYTETKKLPNIYNIFNDIDGIAEVVLGEKTFDEMMPPPQIDFGGNFRYVYQSSDMLFDPLNNITLVNYLFAYIITELYGPDWMTGFCTTAIPGTPKTIMRVLLSDGHHIDSYPRYNDCIKLIELLAHIISDDGGPMPDLSRFDSEPIKRLRKKSPKKRR